jgi:hypothetical protein
MHIIYKCMFRVVVFPSSGVDGRGRYINPFIFMDLVQCFIESEIEVSYPLIFL